LKLELHFAPGSCARVSLIALEEISCPYDLRTVRFMKGEHRSPAYLAINPAGKVPALVVDGIALAQTPAILTFLARSFPNAGLLPLTGDAMADAQIAARLAWFSGDLHPLVTRIRMPQFFCDLDGGPAQVREKGMAGMRLQLAATEAALAGQPWVMGGTWSALDAYLFWVWFRITGAGFSGDDFPGLASHHARMHDRPSVQRALAREAVVQAELEAEGLAVPLR
jgi:glutathione S-transferase